MSIPPEIDSSWKFIWNQVVDVHAQWEVHEQLFGQGQKRIDLLMESGQQFFFVVHGTLLLGIQLTLCKLGDPPQTASSVNLSLRKLVEEIKRFDPRSVPEEEYTRFHGRLSRCLQDFDKKSEKLRERRNKFLGHSDYSTAMHTRPEPILTPTRTEIEACLKSLRSFMREVELYFGEAATFYANAVTVGDGDELVMLLIRGHRYNELMKAEKIDRQDCRSSPWANA